MKINVGIDGVEHTVDIVTAEKNSYKCLVDGRDVDVDVSLLHQGSGLSMYSVLSRGKSYDIILYKNKTSSVVCVNGQNYTVDLKSPFTLHKGREKKLHDGEKFFRILAPIPGKIVAVKVLQEERVKKGQSLVVIEAMKMENELKAPADGIVTEIHVKANDKVEKDAVLLDIDTGAKP